MQCRLSRENKVFKIPNIFLADILISQHRTKTQADGAVYFLFTDFWPSGKHFDATPNSSVNNVSINVGFKQWGSPWNWPWVLIKMQTASTIFFFIFYELMWNNQILKLNQVWPLFVNKIFSHADESFWTQTPENEMKMKEQADCGDDFLKFV